MPSAAALFLYVGVALHWHTVALSCQCVGAPNDKIFQISYNYFSRHNDFRAELGEEISLSFLSLEASLALICPDYAEELRCIVQEWGVTGEDKQGILLDDGDTHIVYDGAEYIPVACGKASVDLHSVAVLKKLCSPAQQFVFVQDFVKRENGEYCGDIIEETTDFLDAAELFEGLTGRRIEEATPANCVIQSKGEAEM